MLIMDSAIELYLNHLLPLYLTFLICEMSTKSSYPTLLLSLSYGRIEMRLVKLSGTCQSTLPVTQLLNLLLFPVEGLAQVEEKQHS